MNSTVIRRRARLAAIIPIAAGLLSAVLLAACGGPSPPARSPGGQPIGLSDYQDGVAYSQCMRTHGIADYPDPTSNGGFLTRNEVRNGQVIGATVNGVFIDTVSPQFIAASKACQKVLPNGGHLTQAQLAQRLRIGLQFSQCMRAHGIANFPDPTVSNGKINVSLHEGNGPGSVDPSSPEYQAAMRACQPIIGGA